MHTILINTSKNRFDESIDLLDIQQEIRKYIEINCPLSAWNDPQKGYEGCVRKIGELIDSYKEISNDFNLILYVDLLELQAYVDAHKNTSWTSIKKEATIEMMYVTLVYYLTSTLGGKLEELLRIPNELLIVLEHNDLVSDRADGVRFNEEKTHCVLSLLGLPTVDQLSRLMNDAYSVKDDSVDADPTEDEPTMDEQAFRDQFGKAMSKPWIGDLNNYYQKEIDILLESLITERNVKRACEDLVRSVETLYSRASRSVMITHWVTDRRAIDWHKELRAKRNLQFQLFLLSCVTSQTTIENAGDVASGAPAIPKSVKDPGEDWDVVIATLKAKYFVYCAKHEEAASLSEDCTKRDLIPEVKQFDHERFGLDEYGAKDLAFAVIDVEEEDKKDSDIDEETAEEPKDTQNGTVIIQGKQRAMVTSEKQVDSLFSKNQFKPFDYKGDGEKFDPLSPKATVKQYEAYTQKLHAYHIKYLQKLKVHVADVLAGYAGKSQRNKPALLQKRDVAIRSSALGSATQEFPYAKPGSNAVDNREPDAIKAVADAAYRTARMEYLRFCAGRSVAITNIEKQTNWFLTRIQQVATSMKKIQTVAFGMFWAILALFIPYVVIQWEAITRNLFTGITAIASVAVPLVLLLVICGIISSWQRKRFGELWIEYKKKSDEILEENAKAAERYDRLLSVFIPSLRWIYQYKSDAEFYAECCDMVKAKIAHHAQKLNERKDAVEQLLEDLEYESAKNADALDVSHEIDYNVPFCSDGSNDGFYSVVEQNLLDRFY